MAEATGLQAAVSEIGHTHGDDADGLQVHSGEVRKVIDWQKEEHLSRLVWNGSRNVSDPLDTMVGFLPQE